MTPLPSISRQALALTLLAASASLFAQTKASLPPLPAPIGIPKPAAAGDGPYAPQPILPGGVVVTLYPAGSPFLKADRVRSRTVQSEHGRPRAHQ